MRLFVALIPPEPVVEVLADEVTALRRLPDADRLRWTGVEGWHFTLAFYGEVEEELLGELEVRLERGARRRGPFDISLSGGGRFGDQVLWAGVAGDRRAMARLADTARAAGRRAGVTREVKHGYSPHLTLARSRSGADLRPYVAALDGFASVPWQAAELVLMSSRLPRSGVPGERPRYERVAAWPLGG